MANNSKQISFFGKKLNREFVTHYSFPKQKNSQDDENSPKIMKPHFTFPIPFQNSTNNVTIL
jgi:hypothetical protein